MPRRTFLAEAGNVDAHGCQLDLAGLSLPEAGVPLTRNFDHRQQLGWATVKLTPQGLMVHADVPDHLLHCFPAVGVRILESARQTQPELPITKARLFTVSICSLPNADPSIKRLAEQCPPPHVSSVPEL